MILRLTLRMTRPRQVLSVLRPPEILEIRVLGANLAQALLRQVVAVLDVRKSAKRFSDKDARQNKNLEPIRF